LLNEFGRERLKKQAVPVVPHLACHPHQSYVKAVALPKVAKVRSKFKDLVKQPPTTAAHAAARERSFPATVCQRLAQTQLEAMKSRKTIGGFDLLPFVSDFVVSVFLAPPQLGDPEIGKKRSERCSFVWLAYRPRKQF
jgi:hypothetical protein